MRSQHIWTERDELGSKREVRATRFGGVWRLQAKTAGDLDWTYYERPLLDDLLALKDILERKYQRRRAASEDVASVKKLIADHMRAGS
jgi:phage gp16-like protein